MMKKEKGLSLIAFVIIIVAIIVIGAIVTIFIFINSRKNNEDTNLPKNIALENYNNTNKEQLDEQQSENELNSHIYVTHMETIKKSDILYNHENDSSLVNYACIIAEIPPIMYPTEIHFMENDMIVGEETGKEIISKTYEKHEDNYYFICYIIYPTNKSLSDYELSFSSSNTGDNYKKGLSNAINSIPENIETIYNINGNKYIYNGKTATGGSTSEENYNSTVSYQYTFLPLDNSGITFNADSFKVEWSSDTQKNIVDNYKLEVKDTDGMGDILMPTLSVRLYYNTNTITKVLGNNAPNVYDLLEKQVIVKCNDMQI